MIKILFICHGNICRSTMAQYVLQHMVEQAGMAEQFYIDSAATSFEEIGNGVHPGTRKKTCAGWHSLWQSQGKTFRKVRL